MTSSSLARAASEPAGAPSNMGAGRPLTRSVSSPPSRRCQRSTWTLFRPSSASSMPFRAMLVSIRTEMNVSALLLWLLRSFSCFTPARTIAMSIPIRTLRSHRASFAASLRFDRCASAWTKALFTLARSISRWDGSDLHAYAVTASSSASSRKSTTLSASRFTARMAEVSGIIATTTAATAPRAAQRGTPRTCHRKLRFS